MKILLVFCHPRRQSLSGSVAEAFEAGALKAGHEIEWADLYGEGFDPVLMPEDEPDWSGAAKRYSDTVHQEMERVDRNDAIVMVFPIWWWSMPAMLKGWVDRVWNKDWAYGGKQLKHKFGLMIGLGANDEEGFEKHAYTMAMGVQMPYGIMSYCGIPDNRLVVLPEAGADPERTERQLDQVRHLGTVFPLCVQPPTNTSTLYLA